MKWIRIIDLFHIHIRWMYIGYIRAHCSTNDSNQSIRKNETHLSCKKCVPTSANTHLREVAKPNPKEHHCNSHITRKWNKEWIGCKKNRSKRITVIPSIRFRQYLFSLLLLLFYFFFDSFIRFSDWYFHHCRFLHDFPWTNFLVFLQTFLFETNFTSLFATISFSFSLSFNGFGFGVWCAPAPYYFIFFISSGSI